MMTSGETSRLTLDCFRQSGDNVLFNLGGVLDISLETLGLTSDCLLLSILVILAFNSSLFLLNGGI